MVIPEPFGVILRLLPIKKGKLLIVERLVTRELVDVVNKIFTNIEKVSLKK